MQIDAYVSARRKKQKKRRKYFWSIVIFLAAYFIFFGVVALIVRLPAFQAEHITITGNNDVSQADIMNLLEASIVRKDNLLNAPNSGTKALLGFHNMLIWPDALPSSTIASIPQLAGVTISKNYFLHTITVTITERQPFAIWCMMPADNCFWFDNTGDAFGNALDTEGNSIIVVRDYAQMPLVLGGQVLSQEFLPNLISIIDTLKASGLIIQTVALNDISLQQINVTTVNGPALYFSLRFSADEDAPVLQNLIAKPGFDKLQYIDFTVENRAYYQ